MHDQSWTVEFWIEKRRGRWSVEGNYGLMFPEDGGPSHSIGISFPGRYWRKSYAEAMLRLLEFHARYGNPKLHNGRSYFDKETK